MEKEEYKIEIETTGNYEKKKEFNKSIMLTERNFLALVETLLNKLEALEAESI